MWFNLIFQRLRLGTVLLRTLPLPELAREVLGRGLVVVLVFGGLLFGPTGVVAVLAGRLLWLAWQHGPAASPVTFDVPHRKPDSP